MAYMGRSKEFEQVEFGKKLKQSYTIYPPDLLLKSYISYQFRVTDNSYNVKP